MAGNLHVNMCKFQIGPCVMFGADYRGHTGDYLLMTSYL